MQLGKYVEHQIRKENHKVKTQRMEARRQELKVDWITGGGKHCYRAAKEQGQPPTLVLSRKDGTLTAHPGEIHAMVEEVWVNGGLQQEGLFQAQEGLAVFHGGLRENDRGQEGGHAEGMGGLRGKGQTAGPPRV